MPLGFSRFLPRLLLSLFFIVLIGGHAGRLWPIPFISVLDSYLYDVRVRLFAPNTVDDRIVIVDIDEQSLSRLGHWPWGRDKLAHLLSVLTDDYGAAVVGFDIVFAEPDTSSGLATLEGLAGEELRGDSAFHDALQKLRPKLDYDQLFADALQGKPAVLGYYFSNSEYAQKVGNLPEPSFLSGQFSDFPGKFMSWNGYGGNLKLFQENAAGAGHFNPMVDFDGNIRRIPMLVEYQGGYYEALSLAMVRVLLGDAALTVRAPTPDMPLEAIRLGSTQGEVSIPIDGDAAALVPYRGGERSFRYVSALDVLEKRVPADSISGRIVLIGTTAPGLNDLRTTPVGSSYPGVEVQANMVAGILDGNIKLKPDYIVAADLVSVILAGGLLAVALPLISPVSGGGLALVILAASTGFNLVMWHQENVVLPLASVVVAIFAVYAVNIIWGLFYETRIKRQVTELFGQYVPPELVQEMARNPGSYSMAGKNSELTVLFSDVRGFTQISEHLDPRELTSLMNEYLSAMTSVIRRYRGTLDKYIGDAIMAFWGAPIADLSHANNAVLTALEMQKVLQELNKAFLKRGWPELQIGVGINTGVMTVGDMGSSVRKAYTVMGDAVNLGSRLEGLTKEYGVGIIVSESTCKQAPNFVYRELDRVRVKGKAEPVTIYCPIGRDDDVNEDQLSSVSAWHEALQFYRQQAWDRAEAVIQQLKDQSPESKLFALYLARIAALRLNPPDSDAWDGVTTFKTK